MLQTTQQDSAIRFWNRISKSYEAKPIADLETYEQKLAITQEYLTPDTRLLEVGCGTGKTAVLHAPRVQSVTATDFSGDMIEIANQQLEATDLRNVKFEVADAMKFYGADSYDTVMAMSVVHLLENPKAFIEQAREMLAPGGYFITSTVCLSDLAKFLKPVAGLGRKIGLLPRLSFFTCDELIGMIGAAGFTIEHEWRPKKGSCFVVARAN